MALTKVTGHVVKTDTNVHTHNINSSGIVTSIGLDINGNADISGNLGVGGTLTYQDVTNVDAVGVITARSGVTLTGGVIKHTGQLKLIAPAGNSVRIRNHDDSDNVAVFNIDGNTHLYYDSSHKFSTVSDGIDVVGNILMMDSLTHRGDTNTKIRFPADDTVTVETGGTERLRINPTGITTIAGQTTIAHTGYPQLILKDSDSNSPNDTNGISLRSANNTEYGFIGNESNGGHSLHIKTVNTVNPIRLKVNNTTRLEVGNSGCYVTGVLDVASGGTTNLRGDTYLHADVYIPDKIIHTGDTNTAIRFPANDTVTVETGGTERLRIHATGELQIGDSTKSSLTDRLLQIGKTDRSATYLELRTSTSGTGGIVWSDNTSGDAGYRGTIEYNQNDDNMFFKTAATERLRISHEGKVGIGNNAPSWLLHLQQSSGTTTLGVKNTGGNSTVYVEASSGNTAKLNLFQAGTSGYSLQTGSTDALQIFRDSTYLAQFDNSGRFMIGTTTEGAGTYAETLTLAGSTHCGMTLRSATNGVGSIYFSDGTSGNSEYRGYFEYHHTSDFLTFATASTERLRITSAGDVGISTAAPASKLHLYDSSSDGLIVQSPSGLHYVWAIQANGNLNNGSLAGELGIRGQSGVSISANNGTATQLRITSAGVVETGTAVGGSGYDSNMVFRIGRAGDCNLAIRNTANTTSHTGVDFGDSGDDRSGRIQYMHNGDYMSFHTNGAGSGADNERLRIHSDGKISTGGITNPQGAFCLDTGTGGTQANTLELRRDSTSDYHAVSFFTGGTCDWSIGQNNAGSFDVYENGGDSSTRFTILQGGNTGVGIDVPAYTNALFGGSQRTLHVSGSAAPMIRIQSSTSGQADLLLQAGNSGADAYIANAASNGDIAFSTNNGGTQGTRLRIDSTGRIDIKGDSGNDGFTLSNAYGQAGFFGGMYYNGSSWVRNAHGARHGAGVVVYTGGHVAFLTSPENSGTTATMSERMRLSNSGTLSIGGLAPAISAVHGLEISNAATTEIRLKNTSGGTGSGDGFAIQKWSNGNTYLWEYDAQDILIGTSNGERIRVDSGGNVGVGNWGATNIPQPLSVLGNIYQRQGDVITWNNGDCQIGGVSGYHFVISTYTGSAMTEKMRVTSGGTVQVKNHLTSQNGIVQINQVTTTTRWAGNLTANVITGGSFTPRTSAPRFLIMIFCPVNTSDDSDAANGNTNPYYYGRIEYQKNGGSWLECDNQGSTSDQGGSAAHIELSPNRTGDNTTDHWAGNRYRCEHKQATILVTNVGDVGAGGWVKFKLRAYTQHGNFLQIGQPHGNSSDDNYPVQPWGFTVFELAPDSNTYTAY